MMTLSRNDSTVLEGLSDRATITGVQNTPVDGYSIELHYNLMDGTNNGQNLAANLTITRINIDVIHCRMCRF